MMENLQTPPRYYPDHQPVRRCDHGQFRLPDEGLVDPWPSPFGRVYSSVVRVRPRREGSYQASGRGDSSAKDLAAVGLR